MNSLLRNCQLTHITPIAGFSMPVWSQDSVVSLDSRNTENYAEKAAQIGAGSGD